MEESITDYYTAKRPHVLEMFPECLGAVLDIGCAAGTLGADILQSGRARRVVGVELFHDAAEIARKKLNFVYEGDVEADEVWSSIERQGEFFDTIVCADVLEHLREPHLFLSRVTAFQKGSYDIFIILPNVRHISIVYKLLVFGEWTYKDHGILDKTHLRFYTKRSALEGLRIANTNLEFCGYVKKGRWQWLSKCTYGLLDDFLAPQFMYKIRVSGDP